MKKGPTEVRVDRVVIDADMRRSRSLVDGSYPTLSDLRPGHINVLVSRNGDMLRWIDCEGGLHTKYRWPGEPKYDGVALAELVNEWMVKIGLHLIQGHKAPVKRHKTLSLPRKKKAA